MPELATSFGKERKKERNKDYSHHVVYHLVCFQEVLAGLCYDTSTQPILLQLWTCSQSAAD